MDLIKVRLITYKEVKVGKEHTVHVTEEERSPERAGANVTG